MPAPPQATVTQLAQVQQETASLRAENEIQTPNERESTEKDWLFMEPSHEPPKPRCSLYSVFPRLEEKERLITSPDTLTQRDIRDRHARWIEGERLRRRLVGAGATAAVTCRDGDRGGVDDGVEDKYDNGCHNVIAIASSAEVATLNMNTGAVQSVLDLHSSAVGDCVSHSRPGFFASLLRATNENTVHVMITKWFEESDSF